MITRAARGARPLHPVCTEERGDLRCDCGCLLARRIGDHIELKCKRCKRLVGIAVLVSTGASCECESR